MTQSGIPTLLGEELNGVCFVMDYVEFTFNGPTLRALAGPVLLTGQRQVRFPDSGSRDALCSLIGDSVAAVEIEEDIAIRLRFVSGRSLEIPLHGEGPEFAHFVPGDNGSMEVW